MAITLRDTPVGGISLRDDGITPYNSDTFNAQTQKGGLLQEFNRGWTSSGLSEGANALYGEALKAKAAGDTQAEVAAKARADGLRSRADAWAPSVQNASDIDGVGSTAQWFAGSAGNLRSSIAPALGGLAGGLAGTALAPVTGGVINPVTGAMLGAGAVGYNQMTNEAWGSAMNSPEVQARLQSGEITPQDVLTSGRLTGAAQAPLEALVPAGVGSAVAGAGRKMLTKQLTEAAAQKGGALTAAEAAKVRSAVMASEIAKTGAGRFVAKEAGVGAVEEALTEGGQDLIGQTGLNNIAGTEGYDLKQTLNSMAAGAAPGSLMGGAGGAASVAWNGTGATAEDGTPKPSLTERVGNAIADVGGALGKRAGEKTGKARNDELLAALAKNPSYDISKSAAENDAAIRETDMSRAQAAKEHASAVDQDEDAAPAVKDAAREFKQRSEAGATNAHEVYAEQMGWIERTQKTIIEAADSVMSKLGFEPAPKKRGSAISPDTSGASPGAVGGMAQPYEYGKGFESKSTTSEQEYERKQKSVGVTEARAREGRILHLQRVAHEKARAEKSEVTLLEAVNSFLSKEEKAELRELLGGDMLPKTPKQRFEAVSVSVRQNAPIRAANMEVWLKVDRAIKAYLSSGGNKDAKVSLEKLFGGADSLQNALALYPAAKSDSNTQDFGQVTSAKTEVSREDDGEFEGSSDVSDGEKDGAGEVATNRSRSYATGSYKLPSEVKRESKGGGYKAQSYFDLRDEAQAARFEKAKAPTRRKVESNSASVDVRSIGMVDLEVQRAGEAQGRKLGEMQPAARELLELAITNEHFPKIKHVAANPRGLKDLSEPAKRDHAKRRARFEKVLRNRVAKLNARYKTIVAEGVDAQGGELDFVYSDIKALELDYGKDPLNNPKATPTNGTLVFERADAKKPFMTTAPKIIARTMRIGSVTQSVDEEVSRTANLSNLLTTGITSMIDYAKRERGDLDEYNDRLSAGAVSDDEIAPTGPAIEFTGRVGYVAYGKVTWLEGSSGSRGLNLEEFPDNFKIYDSGRRITAADVRAEHVYRAKKNEGNFMRERVIDKRTGLLTDGDLVVNPKKIKSIFKPVTAETHDERVAALKELADRHALGGKVAKEGDYRYVKDGSVVEQGTAGSSKETARRVMYKMDHPIHTVDFKDEKAVQLVYEGFRSGFDDAAEQTNNVSGVGVVEIVQELKSYMNDLNKRLRTSTGEAHKAMYLLRNEIKKTVSVWFEKGLSKNDREAIANKLRGLYKTHILAVKGESDRVVRHDPYAETTRVDDKTASEALEDVDQLTGLPNETGMLQYGREEVKRDREDESGAGDTVSNPGYHRTGSAQPHEFKRSGPNSLNEDNVSPGTKPLPDNARAIYKMEGPAEWLVGVLAPKGGVDAVVKAWSTVRAGTTDNMKKSRARMSAALHTISEMTPQQFKLEFNNKLTVEQAQTMIDRATSAIKQGEIPDGRAVVDKANADSGSRAAGGQNDDGSAGSSRDADARADTAAQGDSEQVAGAVQRAEGVAVESSAVNVWHGSGENANLSNLAAREFTHEGKTYLSVEHAYQTLKSGEFDQSTYEKYKYAGKKITGRKGTKTEGDWNIKLMETLVRESFDQNPEAMTELTKTGSAQITHRQDSGVWGKEFPRILMEVRGEKKANQQSAQKTSDVFDDAATTSAELKAALAEVKRLVGDDVIAEAADLLGPDGQWSGDQSDGIIRIAVGAIDKLGVGRHEALHQLFSWLRANGSENVQKLIENLATNQTVMSQLKRELKDEKAALEQLKDPEEAAAYLFQFWLAGRVKLGPSTKTLFEKIKAFIEKVQLAIAEKVFGSETAAAERTQMKRDELAENILAAFASGALADPSKRNVVLEALNGAADAVENRRKNSGAVMSKLAAFSKKALNTAGDTFDSSTNPYLKALGARFFRFEGQIQTKQAFLERYAQINDQKQTKIRNILHSLDKDGITLANEYLTKRTPLKDIHHPEAHEAVKAVRAYLKEMQLYLADAKTQRWDAALHEWVNMGEVKEDYYPRVWDTDAITSSPDKFLEKLTEALEEHRRNGGYQEIEQFEAPKMALGIMSRLINAHGDEEGGANEITETTSELGINPYMASVNRRELTWLKDADFVDFLSKDIVRTLTNYTAQAVKRAEFVREFGNGGEQIITAMHEAIVFEMGGEKLVSAARKQHVKDMKWWRAAVIEADENGKRRPKKPTLVGSAKNALREQAKKSGDTEEQRTAARKKIHEDHIAAVKKLEPAAMAIQAFEGTLGHDIDPKLRNVLSGITTYQNFRLLPLALFASINDTVGMIARGGTLDDAWKGFVRGVREIRLNLKNEYSKDELTQLAEEMGIVSAGNYLDAHGQTYSSQFMHGKLRKLNDALFKYNGLEGWNRGMRIQATGAAVNFIKAHLTKPNEHSKRYLTELFGEGYETLDLMNADGELNYQSDKVKEGVFAWVNGAILRPNASMRPIYASDPRYQLLYHLKQFAYAFHKVILRRAWIEAKAGNYAPGAVLFTGYVPVSIAADAVKELLLPDEDPPWTKMGLGAYLSHGVSRANLGGVPQMMLGNVFSDPTSILGPAVDQVGDMVKVPFFDDKDFDREALGALPGGVMFRRMSDWGPFEG